MPIRKVQPLQISKIWRFVSHGLCKTIPSLGENQAKLREILTRLVAGSLQCWVIRDEARVYGFALTGVTIDYSGTPNLHVYALYSVEEIPVDLWQELFQQLRLYGRSRACESVYAYSRSEHLLSIVYGLGGNIDYRVAMIGVGNE